MINKKRLELLTDKERTMYKIAKSRGVEKKDFDELKEKYIVAGNSVLCVVKRQGRIRDGILIERANYNGMKDHALAGFLLKGETIDDFINHRLYMKKIIKKRVDEAYLNSKYNTHGNKRN